METFKKWYENLIIPYKLTINSPCYNFAELGWKGVLKEISKRHKELIAEHKDSMYAAMSVLIEIKIEEDKLENG